MTDNQTECPKQIATIVTEILSTAILSIRVAAHGGNAAYCAVEASHIHNLPQLLNDYDEKTLTYYLEVERDSYLEQIEKLGGEDATAFQPLWNRLEDFLKQSQR